MKNILLIGLGRFGKHIAMEMNNLGHEIMAVDNNEERVNAALPFVTNAQIGDSTNSEFLESLGVDNYDVCFVTIGGNFQNSLETTSLLKELGARLVVSRGERCAGKIPFEKRSRRGCLSRKANCKMGVYLLHSRPYSRLY